MLAEVVLYFLPLPVSEAGSVAEIRRLVSHFSPAFLGEKVPASGRFLRYSPDPNSAL